MGGTKLLLHCGWHCNFEVSEHSLSRFEQHRQQHKHDDKQPYWHCVIRHACESVENRRSYDKPFHPDKRNTSQILHDDETENQRRDDEAAVT